MDINTVKDMVEYIQVTSEVITDLEKQAADMKSELEQSKKIAKEASAPAKIELDSTKVTETVKKMVDAGFLKTAEAEQATAKIKDNPAVLLSFLNKLAERESVEVKPLGKTASGPSAYATNLRESDTHYEQMANSIARKL